MTITRTVLAMLMLGAAGCTRDAPQPESPKSIAETPEAITRWAHAVDSLAAGVAPVAFGYEPRSTEGGEGAVRRLADGSVRIDVDDFGEIGKHHSRYYARDATLRLAVISDISYDRPLSGRVAHAVTDSVWFDGDSVLQWVDTSHVRRVTPDSALRAFGAETRDEFLWTMRMSAATPARDSTGAAGGPTPGPAGSKGMPDPNLRTFSDSDTEMRQAIGRARASVGELLQRLERPPRTQSYISAKVRIVEGENIEHIWLDGLRYDGRELSGRLNDDPVDVTNARRGDPVRVAPNDITDWMAIDGGRLCGGYTLRVQRGRMRPEERAALDRDLSLIRVPDDTSTCAPAE